MCDCKIETEKIPNMKLSHKLVIKYCPTHKAAPDLVAALEAMLKLWENLSREMNWGASALSAETFALMNEEPNKARKALALTKNSHRSER